MSHHILLVVHLLWKNSVALSNTLKIGTPYDNVIPFLRMTGSKKYVYIFMEKHNGVTEALFSGKKIKVALILE